MIKAGGRVFPRNYAEFIRGVNVAELGSRLSLIYCEAGELSLHIISSFSGLIRSGGRGQWEGLQTGPIHESMLGRPHRPGNDHAEAWSHRGKKYSPDGNWYKPTAAGPERLPSLGPFVQRRRFLGQNLHRRRLLFQSYIFPIFVNSSCITALNIGAL
jgi:hypothetical protein